MIRILSRASALVLALTGFLAAQAPADSHGASRFVSLDSGIPAVGGTTTVTVKSPLVGSRVRIALDTQLGPRFVGNFNRPVVALSHSLVSIGGGSIGADGKFEVVIPTPSLGSTVYMQAFVYSNGYIRESNWITLTVGATAAPTFTNASAGLDPATLNRSTTDVDWADLNKDGCPDVVATSSDAQPLLLMGDCTGALVDESVLRLPVGSYPPAGCVEVGDINGDSWPDLFFCGGFDVATPAPNFALLNDRTGHFVTLDSPTAIAILGAAGSVPGGAGRAVNAQFGDSDGDGDLDLLVTSVQDTDHPTEIPDAVTLYKNNGLYSSQFVVEETLETSGGGVTHTARGSSLFADVDHDGDLDIFVVGAFTGAGAQNQLYVNIGGGFFNATGSALPASQDNSYAAHAADFDGDGDLDFFVANSVYSIANSVNFYENVTTQVDSPLFIDSSWRIPTDLGPETKVRLCADSGDLDNDGDIDLVVGIHELPGPTGATDGRAVVLMNQGGAQAGVEGVFVVDTNFVPGLFVDADVSLGDVDFDGDLDIYVGNSGNLFQFDFHDELWINEL